MTDFDNAWAGWISYGTLDRITKVFGHELVEAISDPQPDKAAWLMNRSLNGGNEIGDACNNTVDVLDGMDMQAYWSQTFRACVLPLGSGLPEIRSLSQTSGPATGGTTVVIQGRLFVNVSSVKFGQKSAASFTVNSAGQITAVSPASSFAGNVDVTVTTPMGQSIESMPFQYLAVVTGVAPNSGSMLGGDAITVTGIGLAGSYNAPFFFGDSRALNTQCGSTATECVMASPQHAPGQVALRYGSSPYVQYFTYLGPRVDRINPAYGPEQGGQGYNVDLFGSGFAPGMTVWFGNTASPWKAQCVSSTWCSTQSPPGSGVVNVFVEVNGVRSAAGPQFRFAKIPSVAVVSPSSGPATDTTGVTIVGSNFNPTPGATTIKFGSQAGTGVYCASANLCTAAAPPGTGIVNVTATVNGITSVDNVSFTYTGVVTSVSPNNGLESGGDRVSISGAGFVIGGSVFFGPNEAQSWSCPTLTTCSAVSPAGVGAVDVHFDVNGLHGTTKASGRFTYKPGSAKGWTQWHLPPPSIYNHGDALTNDPVTSEVLYMVPQQGDSDLTFAWDRASQGWVRKNPLANPRPSKGAFAFHEATGKAVLFGGLIDTVQDNGDGTMKVTYAVDNTTWIWDGMNWSIANPPVSPSTRYRASIAYDAAHRKIVLFGGCHDYRCIYPLNDTWTWDGSTWKQESPTGSPSARAAAAMAYSPATSTVILFGGWTTGGPKAETWAWDGQNWSQLQPPNTIPPARVGAGLAYSPADSGLVLYGGRTSLNPSGVYLDDTWIWNGSSWVQANTATSPKMMDEIVGMIYDTALNAVVVVGGDLVWEWGGR